MGLRGLAIAIASIDSRKSLVAPGAPVLLIGLFVVLALAIAGVAYHYSRAQKEAIEREVQNQLLSVADFKVAELSDWRQHRAEEAQALMTDPATVHALRRLNAGSAERAVPSEIHDWLQEICRRLDFASATFTDKHGAVILSVGRIFGDRAHIRSVAEEVIRTNQAAFHDLHFGENGKGIHLGLNLPIRESPGGQPLGALLLGIDPTRLYDMLLRWPVPSESAEALLVRRDGDELVYLNDLRHRQNAALRLRTPIGNGGVPSTQVLRGEQGGAVGLDYRRIPVFAAVRQVSGTPWFLVAKMDVEEVQAPIRRRSLLLAGSTLSLILLAGTVLFLVWRRQQLQFYRARYEADLERQALVGHYDYLTRFANDIILLIDETGRIVEANDRAVATYGCSREELQRMSIRDLRHPSSMTDYARQWQEASERGSLVFECVHQGRDGRPVPVEVSVRAIEVDGSQFRQSIIRDITERKALDEKLRHMLDAYSAVIDSSPAAIVSMTPEFRVTTWNKMAEQMFGWTAAEAIGTIAPFIPEHRRDRAMQVHATVMAGQVISGMRALARCKDGRILNISLSVAPLHDREGGTEGVVLNLLDISEHTRAEEALRRNEFLYRATFDQAAIGMNYVSLDGRFLRVNPRFSEIAGYSQEELLQLHFQDITHPDDLAGSNQNNRDLLAGRSVTASQVKRYLRKDCSFVWVQVTVSLLRSESGEPLHFVSVVDDVTDRMQAEEALRHSEEQFRRVVESAPEGILVERNLRIRYVNPAAMASFGAKSAAELEGRNLLDLTAAEDRTAAQERSAKVAGLISVPPIERTYLRLDGTPFPAEVSAAPIQYDGQVASLVFLRDIADRKQTEAEKHRLEEQLLHAQKMESLGRLAGGVAHDFNNHLTVIAGYCDMLLSDLDANDPTREEVEEIRAAGNKAAALTQQLLVFGRKQIAERKSLNLNEIVTESGKMLRRLIGEQIEIATDLDPALGLVVADRGQMNQVLMNLAINARDAMPAGGRICVQTANRELDPQNAATGKNRAGGPYIMLSVTDTGVGMNEATLQHVFEPFFTTKGIGIGTGLGLSTVYGIVHQSGGWIEVDSQPGKGSQFRIYLPRVAGETLESAEPAPQIEVRGGVETVLLAEDQPELRRLALRILQSNGYRLLEASSGPEALELSRNHSGRIELLVTDVVMPGMSGRELAARLLESRPGIKVLYVSGYTADVIGREGIVDSGVDYLPKPFTPAQLSVKVREVLGQSKSAGRILVLDDDDGVRGLLQQTLIEAGYEARSARDGRAGMRLVAESGFDLVVTDLIMPEQEGIETIRELRQNYPAIRILAVSGALDAVYLKTAGLLGAHATLRKPIDNQQLLRVVRELLG